jgi:hypothetical protein
MRWLHRSRGLADGWLAMGLSRLIPLVFDGVQDLLAGKISHDHGGTSPQIDVDTLRPGQCCDALLDRFLTMAAGHALDFELKAHRIHGGNSLRPVPSARNIAVGDFRLHAS